MTLFAKGSLKYGVFLPNFEPLSHECSILILRKYPVPGFSTIFHVKTSIDELLIWNGRIVELVQINRSRFMQ